MRLNNFRYYLSQAGRSFIRNGLMTVTSVFTVFCCMIIIGVIMVLTLNINYIIKQVEEQCTMQAYIDEKFNSDDALIIRDKIAQIPNVKEAYVFSKEDTFEYMKEVLGDQASLLDGLEDDDNPFRDSVKITLNQLEGSLQTVDDVAAIDGVAEVANNQPVMESIVNVTSSIKNVCLWIMIILALVSIFIIANTIKLAVFARKREINVMKFVGATDWFIRWPFIFEGILIGVVGAIIAFGILSWVYAATVSKITANALPFGLLGYKDIAGITVLVFVLVGAVIGAIGSIMAVRKHLDV